MLLGKLHGSLVLTSDLFGVLSAVELDVAVGGKVRRDATVGSVGSSTAVDSSLHADVSDSALLEVKHLALAVGLEVLEHANDSFARLLWESTTVVVSVVLADGLSSWTTGVSSERNDGFVLDNTLKVLDGLAEVKTSQSTGSLIGVLVVNSQVVNSAFGS